jgi:hypothetical protein
VCDTSFGGNRNLWDLGQLSSLGECKWMWWNVMQVSPICVITTHNENLTIDDIAKQMDTKELLFKFDKLWS